MLCEKCHKKEAAVFYEETVNGVSHSFSLCHDCAKEMQLTNPLYTDDPFSLPYESLFGSLFGHTETLGRSEKACPLCHSTFRQLSKNGKAGCPECYRTFANELNSTVCSIHGAVAHTGRVPARFKQNQEDKSLLSERKAQLKAAVEEENFELAAKLRDEIRRLETEEESK